MNARPAGSPAMSASEKRAALSLSSIYALRMMGLFMILPVFSLYAHNLSGNTPLLIGLAIGIYGLTQAILQIPFGFASDKFGRKPVIVFGLLLFVVGSVVAAMSESIWGVIAGRALQGSGAIAAAVMALAADLSREEHRTKVMAMIGMSIGLAFALALLLGPLLNNWIGVPGIFWLTAVLASLSILVVKFAVPTAVLSKVHRDAEPVMAQLGSVFRDTQLLRLDIGIFILHIVLTSTFVVLPLVLRDSSGLASIEHWKIYFPALVLSVIMMVPFIVIAEKQRRLKQVFVGAISVLVIAEFSVPILADTVIGAFVTIVVFFLAFNLLEASLPSLVSKMAPPDKKGSAMGVYSTFQFMGAFVGGTSGGWLHGQFGATSVFIFSGVLCLVWVIIASSMRSPRYLTTHLINVGKVTEEQARQLTFRITQVQGVAEVIIVIEEGVAYLKVDKNALDENALSQYSASASQTSA